MKKVTGFLYMVFMQIAAALAWTLQFILDIVLHVSIFIISVSAITAAAGFAAPAFTNWLGQILKQYIEATIL